jgi:mobilization protein NikA
VEEKDQRMFNFKVSVEEAETIDAAAKAGNMTRSDYLRSRVLAAPALTPTAEVERLLRHLVYIASRTHVAVYAIPEAAGTISTKQLREMYEGARTAGLEYMAELAERMAKAETHIASQSRKNKPPEAA